MQKRSVEDRFWSKVEKTDGCWVWRGTLTKTGHGHFWLEGRMVRAHRLSYTMLVGEIPNGLSLDHLCRDKLCVNPAHLEAVPQIENVLRGAGPTAENAKKEVCKNGHPLSGRNLKLKPQNGRPHRYCRECLNATNRMRRMRPNSALPANLTGYCKRGHPRTTKGTYITTNKHGFTRMRCKACVQMLKPTWKSHRQPE